MNILITYGLFMMGLLSSTELFWLRPSDKYYRTRKKECSLMCDRACQPKILVNIEKDSLIVLDSCQTDTGKEKPDATPHSYQITILGLLYWHDIQTAYPSMLIQETDYI